MGDTDHEPGWWQASDGNWYPPELHPSLSSASPTVPRRSIPFGNPVQAPSLFKKLWDLGGAARAGVYVHLSALLVALPLGFLWAAANDHHNGNRHIEGTVAVGLALFVLILIPIGTYLMYRGTGGFPKGWADRP